MAVAFDATSGASGQDDLSWTHTPVGTPRGVLILGAQNSGGADELVGCTYGGVDVPAVAGSPFAKVLGDEDAVLSARFLGSGIPTGPQTVVVDVASSGTAKRFQVFTVTATDDTSVEDLEFADFVTSTAPAAGLSTSVETAVFGLLHSGVDQPAGHAPGTGYTEDQVFDFGTQTCSFIHRLLNASAGSVTVDWTSNDQDAAVVAVAIREGVAGGGGTPVELAGAVAGSGSQTGDVQLVDPLEGNVAGTATLVGLLDTVVPLAGDIAGASALQGNLATLDVLEGQVAGLSTLAGDLTVEASAFVELAGSVVGGGSQQGALDTVVPLVGNVAGVSSQATVQLTVLRALAGEVAGTGVLTGDLLSGPVVAAPDLAGPLRARPLGWPVRADALDLPSRAAPL